MKILLIIVMNRRGTNHYSFRIIEDPNEEELERIVAAHGVFTDRGTENSVLEEFYDWVSVEAKKNPNWGIILADSTLRFGPFDKVVMCGGNFD